MNARLDAVFQADLAHCREVQRSAGYQPFWPRLGQAGARLFSPLL